MLLEGGGGIKARGADGVLAADYRVGQGEWPEGRRETKRSVRRVWFEGSLDDIRHIYKGQWVREEFKTTADSYV